MKKALKYLLVLLLGVLIIMQFIRPDKNNMGYDSVIAFEKDTKPSVEVASILKENCYDCHSNQTQYPWYSEVAPFSYWLADHIKDGQKHFNVSVWENYSLKKKDHKLEELLEMVEEGEMPLDSYTWLHGDLNEDQIKLVLQWATLARLQYIQELKISSK